MMYGKRVNFFCRGVKIWLIRHSKLRYNIMQIELVLNELTNVQVSTDENNFISTLVHEYVKNYIKSECSHSNKGLVDQIPRWVIYP